MRSRPLGRRLLATASVLLAVLAGAAVLYASAAVRSGPAGSGVQTFAAGAMSVSNSKQGTAIFDISGIGPGMTGEGEVTIGNTGSAPGALTLASFDRSDAPGRYGGVLSDRLDLRLADVTAGADAEVYAGELVAMPELRMGTLAAGESRTYRFAVDMRDGGPPSSPYVDDNLYQRASTSLGYDWALTEAEEGAAPEPPEPPPLSPVPAPAPTPTAPALPDTAASRALVGDAHPNSLVGTPGDDLIYGLGAADTILGRGGDDYVFGGAGADRIDGGLGNDRLRGGVGADRIDGGPGEDILFARDGEADVLDCGSGADTAYVDERDRARSCEAVHRQYGRLFRSEAPAGQKPAGP
jgi:Ca2+-binding RTX toxin-like protein